MVVTVYRLRVSAPLIYPTRPDVEEISWSTPTTTPGAIAGGTICLLTGALGLQGLAKNATGTSQSPDISQICREVTLFNQLLYPGKGKVAKTIVPCQQFSLWVSILKGVILNNLPLMNPVNALATVKSNGYLSLKCMCRAALLKCLIWYVKMMPVLMPNY